MKQITTTTGRWPENNRERGARRTAVEKPMSQQPDATPPTATAPAPALRAAARGVDRGC